MNNKQEIDLKISKKKINYPINEPLFQYLKTYNRAFKSPLTYDDLMRFTDNFPILDKDGNDTLWEGVMYNHHEMNEIHENVRKIYQRLSSDGNEEATSHLVVDSIDFCTF